jgi:tetratricopeptide (TPR) repeat protein
MLGAFVIQKTGLEQKASAKIEEEIAWTGDPAVVQAQDALDKGKFDEAAAILEKHVVEKPGSADALVILQQVHWRRNDIPAYQKASVLLVQSQLKAHNPDAAWHSYEEFSSASGGNLPAAPWLELIRHLENQQNFDRAVTECDRLANAYPQERPSLLALLTAGRLSLKKLNHPDEALRFYKMADASPVPHLDWESNIRAGITDAELVLGSPVAGNH